MADYPENLKYTKEHEWSRINGKNAVIGITEFAKDQLGDVVYLELPEVGAEIKRGQPFGVVESTKAVSELFAPLTGKVTKVNQELVDAPEGINESPHEKGWMIEIELSQPDEVPQLLSAAQYKDLLSAEER
jgi:glycine cleavage system H protein